MGFVAIEELVKGNPMVPIAMLTLNYFKSNEYSPSIGSYLADG